MASGSLGSLTVDLAANITRFERSLTRAERLADKRAKGIQRTFTRMATGIGAALASFGMVRAIESSLEFADAIGKAADRAGIATDKLQEYRFAADQFGISTQQMDDGLRRFTRRLGVALDGGSFAKDFEQLGVSIRDTSGNIRTSGDVLDDVVVAMGRLESAAQKSKVAAQLFGDDTGPQLALLLGQGEKAINGFAKQARDLGLIMDEELIRNAEKANDELSILTQVLKIEMVEAIVALAPQIKTLATSLIKATSSIAKFFGGISAMDGDEVIAEIERIESKLIDVRERLLDKQTSDGSAADFISDKFLPSEETIEEQIVILENKLLDAELRLGQLNLNKILTSDDADLGEKKNFFTGLTDSEMEAELQRAIDMETYLTEWSDSEGIKRVQNEQRYSEAVAVSREAAFLHGVALLRRFADDNRAIALILIGVQTAKAVKDIQIQAHAAAAQVLAYGQVEAAAHSAMFNYGAAAAAIAKSTTAAAAIESAAALSTGLVIATGLVDASTVLNSGGIQSPIGSVQNPATTTDADAGTFAPISATNSGTSGTITINVNGVVTDEILQDLIIPAIQDATNDKDVILFNSDSRQAIELTA